MRLRFADFVLDLEQYELRRGDDPIELQPKVFELLRYLLENGERAVSKEELLDEVWPGVIVGEAALTRAISQLRRALGDEKEGGIVRTVRGRGYRIVVPVEADAASPEVQAPKAAPPAPAAPEPPPRDAELERRLAVLLSADVVGYSRLMEHDDVGTVGALLAYRESMERRVAEYRGKVVDSPGDNLLAELPSALDAARCALETQRVMEEAGADQDEHERLELRIGIHLGDVLVQGSRLYGDGVNVVARLERMADPGGVCISSPVYDQVHGRLDIAWQDLGERRVKNIERPVRAYRTGGRSGVSPLEPLAASEPAGTVSPTPRSRGTPVLAGALAALLVGGVGIYLLARAPAESLRAPVAVSGGRALPRSIAVLPFANLSPGSEQDYIAEGFSEEIISVLAGIPGLEVAARTSSFAFKDRAVDVRTIGAELGVAAVLEGSVRLAGSDMRITAQLIETTRGMHLWSDSVDRPVRDLFDVQDEIAAAIADRLRDQLGGEAPSIARESKPRNFQAYLMYLRGRAAWGPRTREGIRAAVAEFERAIELDPDFAAAWAGLADGLAASWARDSTEGRNGELLAAAEAAARRAIELDPTSAEAHLALAKILSGRHRDFAGSFEEIERALEIDPGLASAHETYAVSMLRHERFVEARPAFRRALELDRLSPSLNRNMGRFHLFAAEYDLAIAFLLRTLELSPHDPDAAFLLFQAYSAKGLPAEAREAVLLGFPPSLRPGLRVAVRLLGENRLARLGYTLRRLWSGESCLENPWRGAQLLAFLGEPEEMLVCLEKANERHLWYIRVDPTFDPYRSHPGFQDLLVRSGFDWQPIGERPRDSSGS